MKRYRYIGEDPTLRGHTALGQVMSSRECELPNGLLLPAIDNKFAVQLDDMDHPWAYGWHEANPSDWEEVLV